MGKTLKRKRISIAPGVEVTTQAGIVDFLKGHPLLQHCTLDKLSSQSGAGLLVWARNPGSVFWPALIATLVDKPDYNPTEPDKMSPNEYRCVMFLETAFRFAVLQWKDIILAEEDKIDEQDNLVSKYNKYIIKKTWHQEKPYKDAVALLKEFIPLEIGLRQNHAFNMSLERKKIKIEKSGKPPKPSSHLESQNADGASEVSVMITKTIPRYNQKYGLRQSISKASSSSDSSNNNSATTSRCHTPAGSTSTTSGGEAVETLSDISRKAKKRPKVGGTLMKKFTEDKFLTADKAFKLDTKNKKEQWKCATCFEFVEPGTQLMCHDLPHHATCLSRVLIKQKDGSNQEVRKCTCCAEELCFHCKVKVKGEELPSKCSKCDLRFHRSCLQTWPQAEIQGSSGPITCPVHFCHTCLGEQKVFNRMRNFKAFSGGKYRCLKCVSTYHKACCLPAGSIETISGKDFLMCPKHTLPEIKISQRRFGCLSCGHGLKAKDEERVECTLCLQIFHPHCVGYTDKEKDAGMPLAVFARDYKCVSCLWGLFPLYGQVVWFQQPGHSFWPARILYPREAVGRNDSVATRQTGEYSIKYFGAQPSYYDKASRTFPLELSTVKMLTNLKIYQETDKVKSSYEEAFFFNQMVEDLRDSRLAKPEPYYKKIERNIYRTGVITTKKKKEATGPCYCSERTEEDVCSQNSECHNRDTAVECDDSNCRAGIRCRNRMFSQKQRDTENTEQFLSVSKGWAVKASKVFKEGDFVIEYCGEIINQLEMQYRANKKSEEDPLYLLEIDKNTFIDAEFSGNVSRLINHSCEPNCRTEKYTSDGRPVVGVFAQQDIQQGEELTFDYAYGNKSAAPFRCYCGAESCRGMIGRAAELFEDPVTETPNLDLEKYDKQCAKCSYGGYVLCCDFEGCFKVYHKSCANLVREPDDEWYCPDHKIEPEKKRKALKKCSTEPPAKKNNLGYPKPNQSTETSKAYQKISPSRVQPAKLMRTKLSPKPAQVQYSTPGAKKLKLRTFRESGTPVEKKIDVVRTEFLNSDEVPSSNGFPWTQTSSEKQVFPVSDSGVEDFPPCGTCVVTGSLGCSKCSATGRKPSSVKTLACTDTVCGSTVPPPVIYTLTPEESIDEGRCESAASNVSTITGNSEVEHRQMKVQHWNLALVPVLKKEESKIVPLKSGLTRTTSSPRTERLFARRRLSAPVKLESASGRNKNALKKGTTALDIGDVKATRGKEKVAEWLRHSENEEPQVPDNVNKESVSVPQVASGFTPNLKRENKSLDENDSSVLLYDVPSPLSVRPEKNILARITGGSARKYNGVASEKKPDARNSNTKLVQDSTSEKKSEAQNSRKLVQESAVVPAIPTQRDVELIDLSDPDIVTSIPNPVDVELIDLSDPDIVTSIPNQIDVEVRESRRSPWMENITAEEFEEMFAEMERNLS